LKNPKQLRREAKQMFRLCLVRGLLDEARVRLAVQIVLAAKWRGNLILLSYFQRLVKLELSRHTAQVESATSLPVALEASIRSNLDRVYGHGLSTSFALNPALIGGMRIQVGSDVYDGSVRAGLALLQNGF
jgi:F-type H+-transporting ATPase subunit delta